MSPADKLAVYVKANLQMCPDAILIGRNERQQLEANQHPCDPPDLVNDEKPTFCGVPIIWSPEPTRVALVFNLLPVPHHELWNPTMH